MAIRPIKTLSTKTKIENVNTQSEKEQSPSTTKQRHNVKSKNFSISLPHDLYEQVEEYKFTHRKSGISKVIQEALILLLSQQDHK